MKKAWLAGLALALATSTPALAGHHDRSHSITPWPAEDGAPCSGTFSAATLNGTYIFKASGFADDGKPGAVAVLGTLTFDGVGAVTGNLILTRGDSAQNSCADSFTTGGTYTFSGGTGAPGQFAMQIPLTGGGSTGAINFGLLVPRLDGQRALAIQTDDGSLAGVTVCGTPSITSMVLKGSLHRLGDDSQQGD